MFEAAILYQREVMVLQLILQTHQLHLVVVVVHKDTREFRSLRRLLVLIDKMKELDGLCGILPVDLQQHPFSHTVEALHQVCLND